MASVSEIRQRAETLRDSIIAIAGESMLENKEQIVGLLLDQQENKHEDSTGAQLRPYTQRYRLLKEQLGKSGDTDLDLTGEMHATTDLSIDGDQFIINSPALTDTGELKTDWLKRWQKAPIMELTPDNLKEVWPIIQESFTDKANQILLLD